jgi:drug/metabolite transporter (DMT)-like permease
MFFTKVEAYFVLFWFWCIERGDVRIRHIVLLAVHVYGALLLSVGATWEIAGGQLGDLLIVLAMACTSLGYSFAAKASKKPGALASNAVTMLVGGILLAPIAYLVEQEPVISTTSVSHLLLYVLLFQVFSVSLWYVALRSVKSWIVSGLRAVSPLAGAPVAYLLFGEWLDLPRWIGAAIVLGTSTVMAVEHLREKE